MSMIIDIVRQQKLSNDEREDMYSIFEGYYENVNTSRFFKDLYAKDWVIQLKNKDNDIVGFSTLQSSQYRVAGENVIILYSGDTIVEKAYRTNGDLAGAFGHILLKTIEENKDKRVYWLLTSKGVRTYRFLPVFFKSFFPVFDKTPPESLKLIIDIVARDKFGSDYSPETLVVSHHLKRDRLTASEHDPLLLKRSDPHIQFFIDKNPGYPDGDELTCITPIFEENLNSRARRVIDHTKVNWRE